MSYLFDAASGEYLSGTLGSAYSVPITLALWVYVPTHPTAIQTMFAVGADGTSYDVGELRATAVTNQWAVRHREPSANGGTSGPALRTQNIDGAWTPIVGVFTSLSSRTIYVGAIGNTATESTVLDATAGWDNVRVGRNVDNSQQFGSVANPSKLAQIAMWDVALSTADITDYLNGISADQIDPTNLIGYWSLQNDASKTAGFDSIGDLSITGTTYDSDNPPIDYGGIADLKLSVAPASNPGTKIYMTWET